MPIFALNVVMYGQYVPIGIVKSRPNVRDATVLWNYGELTNEPLFVIIVNFKCAVIVTKMNIKIRLNVIHVKFAI